MRFDLATRHQFRFLVLLAALYSMGTVSNRAQAADAAYVPSKVMWATKRSNVGAGTGTGYRNVGRLEVGEEVRVIAKTGNWYPLEPRTEQPRRFVYAPLLSAARLIVRELLYDGGTYHGPTRFGRPHGRGTLTWPDGDRYEGDWVDGKEHGRGISTWGKGSQWEGDRYEGDYVDGKEHGRGVYTWANGDRYEGDHVEGQEHGRGVYTWANGGRYEGDWVDGKRHGYGIETDPGGSVTEGEWRDGAFVAATSRQASTQTQPSTTAASAEPSWGAFVMSLYRSGDLRFDFPNLIVLLVFATGIIWAFDAAVLARRRRAVARQVEGAPENVVVAPPPRLVKLSKGYFPGFLIVLVLRSYIVEPFRIPSNSMMPTLLTGDFILVNKFEYGIRLPVIDTKIVAIGLPERGDIVVFRSPDDPATPFIKRVVGVPGDRIGYYDKVLYINGDPTDQSPVGRYVGVGSGVVMSGASLRVERIAGAEHAILVQPGALTAQGGAVVPEGHYFVLGDNRDNSRDSRYWGTVSEELLIGKAFRIWMNWDFGHGIRWKRIGKAIE